MVELRHTIFLVFLHIGFIALEIYKVETDRTSNQEFVSVISSKGDRCFTPSPLSIQNLTPIQCFVFMSEIIVLVETISFNIIDHPRRISRSRFQKIQIVGM